MCDWCFFDGDDILGLVVVVWLIFMKCFIFWVYVC